MKIDFSSEVGVAVVESCWLSDLRVIGIPGGHVSGGTRCSGGGQQERRVGSENCKIIDCIL